MTCLGSLFLLTALRACRRALEPTRSAAAPSVLGCGGGFCCGLAVKLNANRVVVGVLRGFDQFMNLVLDNTVEVNGTERTDIGMVVIRGNSVVMIEALESVR
eukprot:SM000022S07191  [mRNA]  locus=s22:482173:482668:+ [translate_table: standard]